MKLRYSTEAEKIFMEIISEKRIKNLLNYIMEHDIKLYLHSIRVSFLCIDIGVGKNMSLREIKYLGYAGLLHDVGKLFVPKELFDKKELSEQEKEIVKSIPRKTFMVLRNFQSNFVRKVVVAHHEFYKNDAYPRKRFSDTGELIIDERRKYNPKVDEMSQVLAIVNMFENSLSSFHIDDVETLQSEVFRYLKDEFVGPESFINAIERKVKV